MEKVHIIKKQKNGMEMGFVEEVVRGKRGRFVKNPLAKAHRESLITGIMVLIVLALLAIIVCQRVTIDRLQPIISPI